MRSALVTLLAAAAVAAAVLGVGWTVQAAALPAPERADLIVARASAWASDYRFVESAFAVNGGPASRAQCLQGWSSTGRGPKQRGAVLHFGRRGTVVALEGHAPTVRGVADGERAQLASAQLELAGCPRLLARTLSAAVQSNVRIERATVAGRPAIAFGVTLRHGRLEIYVTPRTYRPVALTLTEGAFSGRSRIHLTRLTPALLTAFAGRG